MKRSPINRGAKRLLRKVRLATVGQRKKRRRSELATFRKETLARSPTCEVCRLRPSVDPHHICPQGRAGNHPLVHDTRNGLAVCRRCHDAIHTEPGSPWLETVHYLDRLQEIDSRNRS